MNRFLSLVIGVALLFGCLYFGKETLALKREGVSAIGTVVDQRTRRHVGISDTSVNYSKTSAPIVEFVTEQGKTIRFQSKLWSSSSTPVGGEVAVLYPREKPEDARINGFFENWLVSLVLGLLGVTAVLYALGIIEQGLQSNDRERFGYTEVD